jgi:hypothetical protein
VTQQRKARVATVVVIAAAVLLVLWRERRLPDMPAVAVKEEAQPHDALYRMLDAVREGDAAAYLDAHTGAAAESLRRAVAETGEERFMQSLQRQNAPLKGIAVNEPERLSPVEAKTRVEYVFADRNEVQTVFFQQVSGKWRIARVESAQRIPTVVPYGTPVGEVR